MPITKTKRSASKEDGMDDSSHRNDNLTASPFHSSEAWTLRERRRNRLKRKTEHAKQLRLICGLGIGLTALILVVVHVEVSLLIQANNAHSVHNNNNNVNDKTPRVVEPRRLSLDQLKSVFQKPGTTVPKLQPPETVGFHKQLRMAGHDPDVGQHASRLEDKEGATADKQKELNKLKREIDDLRRKQDQKAVGKPEIKEAADKKAELEKLKQDIENLKRKKEQAAPKPDTKQVMMADKKGVVQQAAEAAKPEIKKGIAADKKAEMEKLKQDIETLKRKKEQAAPKPETKEVVMADKKGVVQQAKQAAKPEIKKGIAADKKAEMEKLKQDIENLKHRKEQAAPKPETREVVTADKKAEMEKLKQYVDSLKLDTAAKQGETNEEKDKQNAEPAEEKKEERETKTGGEKPEPPKEAPPVEEPCILDERKQVAPISNEDKGRENEAKKVQEPVKVEDGIAKGVNPTSDFIGKQGGPLGKTEEKKKEATNKKKMVDVAKKMLSFDADFDKPLRIPEKTFKPIPFLQQNALEKVVTTAIKKAQSVPMLHSANFCGIPSTQGKDVTPAVVILGMEDTSTDLLWHVLQRITPEGLVHAPLGLGPPKNVDIAALNDMDPKQSNNFFKKIKATDHGKWLLESLCHQQKEAQLTKTQTVLGFPWLTLGDLSNNGLAREAIESIKNLPPGSVRVIRYRRNLLDMVSRQEQHLMEIRQRQPVDAVTLDNALQQLTHLSRQQQAIDELLDRKKIPHIIIDHEKLFPFNAWKELLNVTTQVESFPIPLNLDIDYSRVPPDERPPEKSTLEKEWARLLGFMVNTKPTSLFDIFSAAADYDRRDNVFWTQQKSIKNYPKIQQVLSGTHYQALLRNLVYKHDYYGCACNDKEANKMKMWRGWQTEKK